MMRPIKIGSILMGPRSCPPGRCRLQTSAHILFGEEWALVFLGLSMIIRAVAKSNVSHPTLPGSVMSLLSTEDFTRKESNPYDRTILQLHWQSKSGINLRQVD